MGFFFHYYYLSVFILYSTSEIRHFLSESRLRTTLHELVASYIGYNINSVCTFC